MYFFKHKFVSFLVSRGLHVVPIRCGRCHFCRSEPEGVGDILRARPYKDFPADTRR